MGGSAGVRDPDGVAVVPLQAHPGAAVGGHVLGGGLEVLLQCGEPAAGVEVDQEAGGVPQVDDLGDGAGGGGVFGFVGLRGLLQYADLLGPDAVDALGADDALGGLTLDQVGGADEGGDEGVAGRS